MKTNGRCCIFQPFDKGPYDKRCDDTLVPAIEAAGLEAYRVDRDRGAVIPVETLHQEIRSATICLADISSLNPNVMYELGFAIASQKDVVIICAASYAGRFPFDIQHRGIIQYASDSASDFENLKNEITAKIVALVSKQKARQDIAAISPVPSTHGLQPHELAALAFVVANTDALTGVSTHTMNSDMENAGYTKAATRLALMRLTRLGYIEAYQETEEYNQTWTAYRILSAGEDWLLANVDELQLRIQVRPRPTAKTVAAPASEGIGDDDVPF
jgi:nucleoside 2-deoxyribosyltransferase